MTICVGNETDRLSIDRQPQLIPQPKAVQRPIFALSAIGRGGDPVPNEKSDGNRLVTIARFHFQAAWGVRHARLRYSLLSVFTRIVSPITMNPGTRTISPVSSVASLSWLVAVAPLITGGVSVTSRSTVLGSS